jgi:hypothetical protein
MSTLPIGLARSREARDAGPDDPSTILKVRLAKRDHKGIISGTHKVDIAVGI